MWDTFKRVIKLRLKVKKFSISIIILIFIIAVSVVFQIPLSLVNSNNIYQDENSEIPKGSLIYDDGIIIVENQTISEDIIISNNANLTLINTTIIGSTYVFNTGSLNLLQRSNVTVNIVLSHHSNLLIRNSSVMGTIECRDLSNMKLIDSHTGLTNVWKFDTTNLTINNSSINQLIEYGTGGFIEITYSTINLVLLNGIALSRTIIRNSTILSLIDLVRPLNIITGPFNFNIFTFNISFSTSERIINITWIGWDSPIIDGYLNMTFKIYLDGDFQAIINGSGFFNQYNGSYLMEVPNAGTYNITLISIDGNGNYFSTTIVIEIIKYPNFPWVPFIIVVALISAVIIFLLIFLKYREKRDYFSSLGVILKKEVVDSKIKILLFTLAATGPGIILLLVFIGLKILIGNISIDFMRSMISIFFTLFIYYFGMGFSIVFGAGTIANTKKDGTLSWFFSKPLRRWEYLWGKILAYLIIIIITMTAASLAIIIGGIIVVDPQYYSDIISIGGYTFLIGIAALIPLTSIVVLCSTVFKKVALAYVIPIAILIIIPPLVMFIPILVGHEWPLLFSFTYYYEQLGKVWISTTGGIFGSIGSLGDVFGITITRLNLNPPIILLILSGISAVSLFLATFLFQKQDIP